MKNNILKITGLIMIISFSSCEKKFFYSGEDSINSSPFKRNLLKGDGRWEMSQEDVYYTDNNAQVYLGYKPAEVIGIMEFTEEEPTITIAGDMGTFTPTNAATEQILFQISAMNSIEISVAKWENNTTTTQKGYTAHFGWSEEQMIWEGHNHSHFGDTLVKHTYYFSKI